MQGENYTGIGTGNLDGTNPANDPLFVELPTNTPTRFLYEFDYTPGDLRLQSTSPVIDKGLNSANTIPNDLASNARIVGNNIDLGAYEFQEGPCTQPVITSITIPTDPVAITTPVTIGISYSETNVSSATIDWGDKTEVQIVTDLSAPPTYTYATPGVYTISVTLTNSCGTSEAVSAPQYVVVYDPSAGFVTGGGWITSPTGASLPTPQASGKATFGFVAKYQKGATVPSGNTEFEFRAGGLSFRSTDYQWLTVAGARAQFKGTGTLNGSGSYGFMLTAIDGQISGGGGADKFRIKIQDSNGQTVYDNQSGALDDATPATTLGGGSIVIHTPKGKGAREGYEPELSLADGALPMGAYPNPTRGLVRVQLQTRTEGEVHFEVLDLVGRPVQQQELYLTPGLNEVDFDLSAQPAGLYLIRSRDAAGRQGTVRVSRQ